MVICVKNMSGFVSVNSDGSWLCISDHKHKEEHHPDPVSHDFSIANNGWTFLYPSLSFSFCCR